MITMTNEQIDRVDALLSSVKNGTKVVFNNAINRSVDSVRTEANRQISDKYNISKSDIRAHHNIHLKKSNVNNLQGEVLYSGSKIPLIRFGVSNKSPNSGKSLRVTVLKGAGGGEFTNAFVAKMRSGHVGIFERINGTQMNSRQSKKGNINKHTQAIGADYPNKSRDQFYGPSVSEMVGAARVRDSIEQRAQEVFHNRVNHEINRIINGW